MKSEFLANAFSRFLEKRLQTKHAKNLGKLNLSGGARTYKSVSDVMNVTHRVTPSAYGPSKTKTTMKKRGKR